MRVVMLDPDNRVCGVAGFKDGEYVYMGLGEEAPELYVTDDDGKPVTLADGEERWLQALADSCHGLIRGVLDDGDPDDDTWEDVRYLDVDGDEIDPEYACQIARTVYGPDGERHQALGKFNPNHEPAGSSEGGQFASSDSEAGGVDLASGEKELKAFAEKNHIPVEHLSRALKQAERIATLFSGPRKVEPSAEEKLGITLGKKAPGLCYQKAGQYVMFHSGIADMRLVHGTADNGHGVRIGHAWVVLGDKVYDGTQGQFYDKKSYYAAVKAVEEHVYTHDEAVKWMLKTKNYGHWEGSAGVTAGPKKRKAA